MEFSLFSSGLLVAQKKICSIPFQPGVLKISLGANNPEEFLLYNVRIVHWLLDMFKDSRMNEY